VPPGSDCAIALMRSPERAGTLSGLHLIVEDIDAARTDMADRGAQCTEVFHFEDGVQRAGHDPARRDYNSFMSFSDPDGNSWLVQEVRRQA
jgi:hypothetical protein